MLHSRLLQEIPLPNNLFNLLYLRHLHEIPLSSASSARDSIIICVICVRFHSLVYLPDDVHIEFGGNEPLFLLAVAGAAIDALELLEPRITCVSTGS